MELRIASSLWSGTATIIISVESGNNKSVDHSALQNFASAGPLRVVSEMIVSILNPAWNNSLHKASATFPAPAKEMLL
jgi:hypothetical protein